MQEPFEILKSKEDAQLFSDFKDEDIPFVEKMLARIESQQQDATSILEQERRLLIVLKADCKGMPVKAVVDDIEAYTDAVCNQPVTMAREKRHIGVQTMGLALCAVLLLVKCSIDILCAWRAGNNLLLSMTTLDLGCLIACISFLVSARILVAGDRKTDFENKEKVQKRKALARIVVCLGLLAFLLPVFRRIAVFQLATVYVMGFSVLLLAVWLFSRHL